VVQISQLWKTRRLAPEWDWVTDSIRDCRRAQQRMIYFRSAIEHDLAWPAHPA